MDVFCLLKFSSEKNIRSLLEDGVVYMKTLAYFAKSEEEERGDENEGLVEYRQGPGTRVVYKGKHELSHENSLLRFVRVRTELSGSPNVFCMTAITPSYREVDARVMKRIGDTCLVVREPGTFLDRISAAAKAAGLALNAEGVEYVPADYSGSMSAFRKFAHLYAHQNEFRFAVTPGVEDARILRIGSITDIAHAGPSSGINAHLQDILPKVT